jgi:integrase
MQNGAILKQKLGSTMASIFHQRYTVKDDSGKTIRSQTQHWYIDYKTADGTRKRVKAFKDRTATAQLAAKLEKEAELAQAGIIDRYAEHRKIKLKKHLDDFKQNLLDKGNTVKHADMTFQRANAVIEGCRFVLIADVSASAVQHYLAGKRSQGMGSKTSNYYLKSAKQFLSWMKADGRTGENPLEYLSEVNAQTDIRHKRRALTLDELNTLIETTMNNGSHSGLSCKERAMLYVLASTTGLRASELASLKWSSLHFEHDTPTIKIEAAYSKHRREDVLPLKKDIAELFQKWQADCNGQPDEKIFKVSRFMKWADMLKIDLEAAGIAYQDEAGRFADFHALRHTYITNVVKSGASPKIAQSLARHSKITLTMDTYTHMNLYDQKAALEALPNLPCLNEVSSRSEEVAKLKTGTDDQPVGPYKPPYKFLTKNAYLSRQTLSSTGTGNNNSRGNSSEGESIDKPLQIASLGTKTNALSAIVTDKAVSEAEGARTLNLRIDSPML